MTLHHARHQGQADPPSTAGTSLLGRHPVAEDPVPVLGGHAGTVVGDRDRRVVVVAAERDRDVPAGRGRVDGVVDQVAQVRDHVRRTVGLRDGVRVDAQPHPPLVSVAARSSGAQTGTLGTSWRVKVPIRDDDGTVIGMVSVGIL